MGIVFDIQRFSLHDGPGIRTTVFLKGCPLRCKWCHNPESWLLKPQLMVNGDRCVNCLSCLESCSNGAQGVLDGRHTFDRLLCTGCASCVGACPNQALKTAGYEAEAEAVMKEVLADAAYYRNSGGGLTVSGGEPMLQFGFTKELLELAKARGIHTCMETCGFAEAGKYMEILQLTDLFLFDIKSTDPDAHRELTGVENRLILSNLQLLYEKGARIRLRCPLVPGINDSERHLDGLAELASRYSLLEGVEILPYHDYGKGKWKELGYLNPLGELKSAEEETIAMWNSRLY